MSPVDSVLTPRLRFRRLSLAHAPDLHAMDSDPAVMQFINDCPPVPWEGYEAKTQAWLGRVYSDGDAQGIWAAHLLDDDAFAGWFHLRPGRQFEDHRLELGYRLPRGMWGRGLATEGSRGLLRYGFHELGAPEIMALTLERNLRSRG